jgi:hypothetical protein
MGLSTIFRGRFALLLAIGCLSMRAGGHAQHLATAPPATEVSAPDLPDAPQPALATPDPAADPTAAPDPAATETVALRTKPASKYRLVVRSDEVVPPLTAGDKLKLSLLSRVSPLDVGATVLSAGWSHLRDSDPHYGTDKGAFGERLGALALKQTSQSLFTYGIYAAAARHDPRYYVMGPDESFTRRAVYSASRLVVARTDSGHDAINWPKLAGIASATALTNLYYPPQDHGHFASSFGTSLATSVLTNELHEFMGDAFHLIRPAR